MYRLILSGLIALATSLVVVAWPASPTTHTVKLNGMEFTLPVGFTIELAVKPGLVDRPINIDIDEEGRLYATDSSGSNAPVKQQLAAPTHRIVRLEDTNGDGVYDRQTVFADRMMFPEGALWYDGSLYVSAPPSIWKLTDTTGKGKADRREEWFKGETLTGCANDLHGPYLGLDGRIYWAKGAFAKQTYKRPGKEPFVTRAAHLFRSRPDGRDIEPVMTGGMDNPVDVVFTPSGERLFTTTFLQHPAGGKRDGILHAIPGGIHGKDHDVIYDPSHPWTGPGFMPVMTHLGPAAPSGLHRLESAALGEDYKDNLFAAQFNMHKISRHVLVPDGSTFTTRDSDFLVATGKDFHPTDVIEDADGSLLVVDTGGWYKLCCPTSQLVKPDVLGAIYRIRRTNAPAIKDPLGKQLAWDKMADKDLVDLLGDARPFVVRRALHTIRKRGSAIVPDLEKGLAEAKTAVIRRNIVWGATRIDAPRARRLVRRALIDTDESVRQAALHSVSLHRDASAFDLLVELLEARSASNRRVAAEALGRLGNPRGVAPLLKAAATPNDRMLDHAITLAVIEIGNREMTAAGLKAESSGTRRTALVALDQMPGGKLPGVAVADALKSSDQELRQTAWWIAGRRPEQASAVLPLFEKRLADEKLTGTEVEELVANLARLAKSSEVRTFLQERLADVRATRLEKSRLLRSMAGASIRPAPPGWLVALARQLESGVLIKETLTTIRALPLTAREGDVLVRPLMTVVDGKERTDEERLLALLSLPGGPGVLTDDRFRHVLGLLDREKSIVIRSSAAAVLSRSRLRSAQLNELSAVLGRVGPMELDRLLEAYANASDDAVGEKLIAAIAGAPARDSLRVDGLRSRLAKFGPAVQKKAEALYATLDADAAKQKANLEKLLSSLETGDIRRGQAIFHGEKTACFACHAIGYRGGKIGPDLTTIGRIRTDRDLLESILYPSASFVRSYEPVVVTTTAGKQHSGLVRKDTPEEVILITSATDEVRIAKAQIEQMQPGKVSLMPAGLDKVLTKRELADLIAFLKACR